MAQPPNPKRRGSGRPGANADRGGRLFHRQIRVKSLPHHPVESAKSCSISRGGAGKLRLHFFRNPRRMPSVLAFRTCLPSDLFRFMSSLVSLVVAAAVLLHTLLGCCMHHGHRAADPGVAAGGSAQQQVACGHCHHGVDTSTAATAVRQNIAWHVATERDDRRHDDHQECDDGECSFLASEAPGVDLRRDLLSHWLLADAPSAAGLLRLRRTSTSDPPGACSPPPCDRSQPRLCVWLI